MDRKLGNAAQVIIQKASSHGCRYTLFDFLFRKNVINNDFLCLLQGSRGYAFSRNKLHLDFFSLLVVYGYLAAEFVGLFVYRKLDDVNMRCFKSFLKLLMCA